MALFKIIFYIFAATSLYVAYQYVTLPNVNKINTCFTTTMNSVELCEKSTNYVRLSQISDHLKSAVIISEDASFYSHNGFDLSELQNSLRENLEKGRFARGGSTISQQLSKNLFLTQEKTLLRKAKEVILTQRIEKNFSKNIILEKYLNVVEFGKDLYGIKPAALHYFGKHPSELSPLEGAFLAFLLPNPEKYAVSFKKKELTPFARRRLNEILYKMHFYKKISEDEYLFAKGQVHTMFKAIPEMENEPGINDNTYETEDGVYDLSAPEEINNFQKESIEIIQQIQNDDLNNSSDKNYETENLNPENPEED